MTENSNGSNGKCPVMHGSNTATQSTNMEWWPNSAQPRHSAPARQQE
jgi:catalase-peroxidase